MRLAIAGPTRDTVPASFAVDLAQLYAYTREHGPWQTVTVGFVQSTYIHVGREFILESCLQQGVTHVLWLDTDMSFPPHTAIQLAMPEQPIVACNYVTRDGSGQFTAMRGILDGRPRRIYTKPESTGLEEVDACGMGAMLMSTAVVASVRRPWFQHARNEAGVDVGEDITFCHLLREAGQRIWIDHELSKEIGHVGTYTYRTCPPVEVAV